MKRSGVGVIISAALVAVGLGSPAFAEDENVGGGALEKNRVIREADGQLVTAELFALGARTFDRGWEFRLADSPVNFTKVGLRINDNGITSLFRETNGWTAVDIPHDWMIAMPVVRNGRNGFRAVGENHPENSIGWYRKRFVVSDANAANLSVGCPVGRASSPCARGETSSQLPGRGRPGHGQDGLKIAAFASDATRALRPRVYLQFDGIYRDAQFWVNGIYLGRNDSGYIGCRFDVSDFLEYGGATNNVAVRVNASQTEGWWYEGAGIYRHVKLIVKNDDHIRPDGILFRTLEIADGRAVVSAEAEIEGAGKVTFALDGQPFEKTLTVKNPKLWSPDKPNLHTLVARLVGEDGAVKDEVSLQVGIRQFRFDAKEGLFVNGVPTKVKGVCCHADMAGVGVAIPDALHDYRVKLLKGMGVNADRTCHNPPAPEFLDACDRAGILVMDETRMFSSTPEGLSQFRRLVLRDRNHACVAAFSIGNEEHNVQADGVGARMATRLRDLSHALAPDVAVTYGGNNGSTDTGVNPVVDVRGVNYVRIGSSDKKLKRIFDAPDRYHAAHPDQPIWSSEEASSLSTRGSSESTPGGGTQLLKDSDRFEDNIIFPWAATAEQCWNYAAARPWFAGVMLWTGFDYRGESRWPATINNFGIMDLCGFPKASYWYYKANWTDKDVVNAWPPWRPGVTNLWVDSNCESVEVFVNGRSVGMKAGDRLHHLSFPVAYEAGRVEVRGVRGGRTVTFQMKTPAPTATLVLTADRTTLAADGVDATVVNVQAFDVEGDEASAACDYVYFECEGAGKIIGVGNGDPLSHEDDICPMGLKIVHTGGDDDRIIKIPMRDWKRKLFNGKCQLVIQAADKPGKLTVRANLPSANAVTETTVDVAK